MTMCDLHWVPRLRTPLVARFHPIDRGEIRVSGDTIVIRRLPVPPVPDIFEYDAVRPDLGKCPVCDA